MGGGGGSGVHVDDLHFKHQFKKIICILYYSLFKEEAFHIISLPEYTVLKIVPRQYDYRQNICNYLLSKKRSIKKNCKLKLSEFTDYSYKIPNYY